MRTPKMKYDCPLGNMPLGKQRTLHEDILRSLGGVEAIARRLGVAPSMAVTSYGIQPNYYSAIALMMRDAGYRHITVHDLLATLHEREEREQKEKFERDTAHFEEWWDNLHARAESEWIRKNGAGAAWWELRPENRPVLVTDLPAPIAIADAATPHADVADAALPIADAA